MSINKSFILLFVLIFSASLSYAQTDAGKISEKVDEKSADVAITAKVEAKEVIFEAVPNPKVEFFGKPERKTEWSSERKNLPEQVQPGVTYRNIGITLKIVSIFADIDRIVDEALGIKPQTETSPREKQAENQNNQTPNKPRR